MYVCNERDTACLLKFFTHKLQFQIPESELENLFLSWDSVLEVLNKQSFSDADSVGTGSNMIDGSQTACLANKAQLRLDADLKASGYNDAISGCETHLHYQHDETNTNMNSSIDEKDEDHPESEVQDEYSDSEKSFNSKEDNISHAVDGISLKKIMSR